MKAKKLTLIGVLAVAVAVAGCSDNGINSINNPNEADFNKVSTESYEDNLEISDRIENVIPRRLLTVIVSKSEIEGGCWYLSTKYGKTFEPLFEQKAPKLFNGMRLRISGYVDTEISTICQIAPVFRIEKFKILKPAGGALAKPEEGTGEERDVFVLYPPEATELRNTYPENTPVSSIDANNRITLKGFYGVTKRGCMFLKINKDVMVELNFQQGINPKIKENTLIKVIGDYSLLTGSRCLLGPIFNVVYFDII